MPACQRNKGVVSNEKSVLNPQDWGLLYRKIEDQCFGRTEDGWDEGEEGGNV